jgi:hypothetical protein
VLVLSSWQLIECETDSTHSITVISTLQQLAFRQSSMSVWLYHKLRTSYSTAQDYRFTTSCSSRSDQAQATKMLEPFIFRSSKGQSSAHSSSSDPVLSYVRPCSCFLQFFFLIATRSLLRRQDYMAQTKCPLHLGLVHFPIPTQNIFSSTHHIKSFDVCMEH